MLLRMFNIELEYCQSLQNVRRSISSSQMSDTIHSQSRVPSVSSLLFLCLQITHHVNHRHLF